MAKFVPTKRGNPCPICDDTKGKCRSIQGSDTILCMSFADSDANAVGWKYLGLDKKQRLWGIYVPDDGKQDGRDREQRRAERAAEAERERQRELKTLSEALPLDERSAQNRRFLSGLNLDDRHRQNLRDRGLTDKQIAAIGFRSVSPRQRLKHSVSPRLAGVGYDGLTAWVPDPGFLCPAFDADGRILGFQIRLDTENGKYRWLKSKFGSKLPNGEMPITVARPDGEAKAIALIEGILKPQVAAKLSGDTVFLGAAGGNFTASPKQLKAALSRLVKETGTKTLLFVPDADGLRNAQVFRRDMATVKLLRRWGYDVRVLYWGQGFDKSVDDYDDLLAAGYGDTAKVITVAQYKHLRWERQNPDRAWKLPFEAVRNAIDKLKPQGFGAQPEPKPAKSKSEPRDRATPPTWTPGSVPQPDGRCHRLLLDDNSQAADLLVEAVGKGWHHILDRRRCGSGKSYLVGILQEAMFRATKIWYLTPTHRNPTTAPVETNYVDLEPRHPGFVTDADKTTELGTPHRRWAQRGETPDTEGNCHRSHLFRALGDKNIPDIEGTDNPICGTCHLRYACQHASGHGYGHRFERQQTLKSGRVRAHPDSLPRNDYDYANDIAFWDEVRTTFSPTETINATSDDLNTTAGYLALHRPDLLERLSPYLQALEPLLSGKTKQPYHGWNDDALREIFPTLDEATARELSEELTAIAVSQELPLESEDSIDYDKLSHRDRRHLGRFNKLLKEETRQSSKDARAAVEGVVKNWLAPFVEVLGQAKPGAMRIHWRTLTLTLANQRHRQIAQQMKANIYQDATMSPQRLAMWLGCDESDILVIESPEVETPNVTVTQIPDVGLATNGRTPEADRRISALKAAIVPQHNNVAVCEWKSFRSELPENTKRLTNLGDTRGSNAARDADALIIDGTLYRNIGALEDEYRAVTGRSIAPGTVKIKTPRHIVGDVPDGLSDYAERTVSADPGLQQYIDDDVNAEMEQARERLRAHLRPNEQLSIYIISSHPVLFPVELVRAMDITPEAGTKQQRKWHAVTEAVRQLKEWGEKVTQQAIAAMTDIPQNTISRLCQAVTGMSWRDWQKISISLIEAPYKEMDNLSGEDLANCEAVASVLEQVAFDIPPQELIEELAVIYTSLPGLFPAVVRRLSRSVRSRLLAASLAVFPDSMELSYG